MTPLETRAREFRGVFDTNEMPRPLAALDGGNNEWAAPVLRGAGLLAGW